MVSYNSQGYKNVTLYTFSNNYCWSAKIDTLSFKILDCSPKIDSYSYIIDSNSHFFKGILPKSNSIKNKIWILPNVNYSFDSDYQYYSNAIFYLEVGASLKFNYLPSDSQIEFYLKPGSTLEVTHGNIYNCAIIKSKYASFNYDKGLSFDTKQSNLLIECDDLQFAYSEAPKDGIKIMQALGYLDVPEEYNNNFNIYPNPSSNVLRFNEDYENANIKIYNISGELVFNSSYKKEIDISNFNIGTYIVSIQSANKLYTSKFEVLK